MAPERSSFADGNQLRNMPKIITSVPSTSTPFGATNIQAGNPPPVPPRQPAPNYSGFNDYRPFGSNYSGGYGGYGYGNQYRGINGYGGYNSYGSGPYSSFNNYGSFGGHSGDVENRFFQYVEDSTRPTFQLIETVLQTFSSMTMLLESTYFALTSSFKAILSVAENVGRLRSTVGQLFSTFALIRFLKWLYRKIVSTAGLQGHSSINDELWDKSLVKTGNENVNNSPFWSGFLIFGVFVVIPYMIHKIANNIKHIQMKGKDPKEWHQFKEPMYIAIVQYDFGATNNDELSIHCGQKVYLAPQSLQPKHLPGWCKVTDNANVGLVPFNYIKIVGQLKKRNESNVTSPNEDKPFASNSSTENSKIFEREYSNNEEETATVKEDKKV